MTNNARSLAVQAVSKVPELTLGFWVIKIAATTLGEIGGDWVTMSLKLGYLIGTAIFAVVFIGLVSSQIKVGKFYPSLYWATIVATTTLGTTIADFCDRSLGVGYPGGVAIVFGLLIVSLAIWYWTEGSVSVHSIAIPRVEWFYWCTIMFSQTLGTALGDWVAGSDRGGLGFGYEYGALIFGAGLAVVGALYFWTRISRTALFWVAFILTRPLGATLGDLLDKPLAQGGLHVSRLYASLILLCFFASLLPVLRSFLSAPRAERASGLKPSDPSRLMCQITAAPFGFANPRWSCKECLRIVDCSSLGMALQQEQHFFVLLHPIGRLLRNRWRKSSSGRRLSGDTQQPIRA